MRVAIEHVDTEVGALCNVPDVERFPAMEFSGRSVLYGTFGGRCAKGLSARIADVSKSEDNMVLTAPKSKFLWLVLILST